MLDVQPMFSDLEEVKMGLIEVLESEVKQYYMAVHYKTGLETYYEGKAKSIAQFAGKVFGTQNDRVNRMVQDLKDIDDLRQRITR